jgi:hypothetical protein
MLDMLCAPRWLELRDCADEDAPPKALADAPPDGRAPNCEDEVERCGGAGRLALDAVVGRLDAPA